MRNQLLAFLIFSIAPLSAYAQPPSTHYTEMTFDTAKVSSVSESTVIEEALKHYNSMDKANKNSLTHANMTPHMTDNEMKTAEPERNGSIGRGGYIVETVKRFELADKNHDGKISHAEWQSPAGQNLLRMLRMPAK